LPQQSWEKDQRSQRCKNSQQKREKISVRTKKVRTHPFLSLESSHILYVIVLLPFKSMEQLQDIGHLSGLSHPSQDIAISTLRIPVSKGYLFFFIGKNDNYLSNFNALFMMLIQGIQFLMQFLSYMILVVFSSKNRKDHTIQKFTLRMVPTIVIAHAFCTSPDTWISYRQCLLIQGYFCAV